MKTKCFQPLCFILISASAIFISLKNSRAEVIYRENFGVESNALPFGTAVTLSSNVLADLGWHDDYSSTAHGSDATVGGDYVSYRPSAPSTNTLPAIHSGDANTNADWGFFGMNSTGLGGPPNIAWTAEHTISSTTYDFNTLAFSWYQGDSSASDECRLAVQIGGNWYATATTFSTPSMSAGSFPTAGIKQTFNFTRTNTAWMSLDFIESNVLSLGTILTTNLPDGDITAFGWYNSSSANDNLRFDTLEIDAIPAESVGKISVSPPDGTFYAGRPVTLSAAASLSGTVHYDWQESYNGGEFTDVTDSDTNTILVDAAPDTPPGSYIYQVIASNGSLSITSAPSATLTILAPLRNGAADIIYVENFGVVSNALDFGTAATLGSSTVASLGWNANYTPTGTNVIVSSGGEYVAYRPSAPTTNALPAVNSGTANTDPDWGFFGVNSTGVGGAPNIAWTSEYTIRQSSYDFNTLVFSWHQGDASSADNCRLAVQINGDWYVTTNIFSTPAMSAGNFPADGVKETYQFTRTNTAWMSLDFTPNSSLVLGSMLTTNLPNGDITAFGWFTASAAGDNLRFDTLEIDAVPAVNTVPVAAPMTVYRTAGLNLKIALSDLATNWSDADGDTVTLSGVNSTTTNGVDLATNNTYIFYPDSANVNDQFSYTISDGRGSFNTGVVNIIVIAVISGGSQSIAISGNSATVNFAGIPNYNYSVQRSTNLVDWTTIWTTNAPVNGLFNFTDSFSDLGGVAPPSAYYRLNWQP